MATPNEAPKGKVEKAPLAPGETEKRLAELKEQVAKGQFETVTKTLIGTAAENGGEIPQAVVDTFIETTLNAKERQSLTDFLSNKTSPQEVALRKRLAALQTEVGGKQPENTTGSAAGKILGAIDGFIKQATEKGAGPIQALAEKVGIKGDITPDKLGFLKNTVVGFAAKLFESVAMSLSKINPSMDLSAVIRTPMELRLTQISDPAQKKKYEAAYLAWAKNPAGRTPPTLAEALNPAPQQSAPGAEKPQTVVAEAKKVEGTQKITIPGKPEFSVTRGADKKNIVEVAGAKREMKVPNGQVLDVLVRQPTDKDAGVVEFLMTDNRRIAVDPAKLLEVAGDKTKTDIAALDGTKIEIAPAQTA